VTTRELHSRSIVPDQTKPSEADVDTLSERLQDGIQSCRSVIANYRSLLTESPIEAPPTVNGADEAPDSSSS
jgi:hypothetical protein